VPVTSLYSTHHPPLLYEIRTLDCDCPRLIPTSAASKELQVERLGLEDPTCLDRQPNLQLSGRSDNSSARQIALCNHLRSELLSVSLLDTG
jgi:hypothetical protein